MHMKYRYRMTIIIHLINMVYRGTKLIFELKEASGDIYGLVATVVNEGSNVIQRKIS